VVRNSLGHAFLSLKNEQGCHEFNADEPPEISSWGLLEKISVKKPKKVKSFFKTSEIITSNFKFRHRCHRLICSQRLGSNSFFKFWDLWGVEGRLCRENRINLGMFEFALQIS